MVDSGASIHFCGYKKFFSNLVERGTSLKFILEDNSTYLVKGFGSRKFNLDSRDIFLLHEVMYILGVKKNLISISSLEDKWMRVSFIRGKFLTWPMESDLRDDFTLGSRMILYRFNVRTLLEMFHHINC